MERVPSQLVEHVGKVGAKQGGQPVCWVARPPLQVGGDQLCRAPQRHASQSSILYAIIFEVRSHLNTTSLY